MDASADVMDWVPLLVAGTFALAIVPGGLRAFTGAGWLRANFRGESLPFPGGLLGLAAALAALGALAAADVLLDARTLDAPGVDTVVVVGLGVGLLGLADDLLDAPARGWRGHAAELLRGGFSTGALKAGGTVALACFALAADGIGTGEYILAVALVVLATNLFNLLDLRPGRAAKAWLLLAVGLLAGSGSTEPLRALGAFAGPLLVLGFYDLRERTMLGDTGANVLGALAGVWLVLALNTTGQLVALALVVALTVYAEFRSLSAAIERVPPLRVLDCLGRRADG